ncbi:MAG TPA: fibronectin type III domain-containing protein [Noviherbaspirillum sp.]
MVRFGRTFVDNAGYNRWADTNNIVVLYPQTTNGNGNPNGCWDWWGYDDPNYAKKNGLRYRPQGSGSQYMKANSSLITTTSYTVGGLKPGTAYSFVVQSQNSAGTPSADSNEVIATTSAATACFTASNFAHVSAGRAHDSGGYALANGSNMKMGLDNIFITTTLKETKPGFYAIDHLTCP